MTTSVETRMLRQAQPSTGRWWWLRLAETYGGIDIWVWSFGAACLLASLLYYQRRRRQRGKSTKKDGRSVSRFCSSIFSSVLSSRLLLPKQEGAMDYRDDIEIGSDVQGASKVVAAPHVATEHEDLKSLEPPCCIRTKMDDLRRDIRDLLSMGDKRGAALLKKQMKEYSAQLRKARTISPKFVTCQRHGESDTSFVPLDIIPDIVSRRQELKQRKNGDLLKEEESAKSRKCKNNSCDGERIGGSDYCSEDCLESHKQTLEEQRLEFRQKLQQLREDKKKKDMTRARLHDDDSSGDHYPVECKPPRLVPKTLSCNVLAACEYYRCGKRGLDRSVCAGCRKITYCDQKCQRMDWKRHQKECRSSGYYHY